MRSILDLREPPARSAERSLGCAADNRRARRKPAQQLAALVVNDSDQQRSQRAPRLASLRLSILSNFAIIRIVFYTEGEASMSLSCSVSRNVADLICREPRLPVRLLATDMPAKISGGDFAKTFEKRRKAIVVYCETQIF